VRHSPPKLKSASNEKKLAVDRLKKHPNKRIALVFLFAAYTFSAVSV
jgi:hypothetical protein